LNDPFQRTLRILERKAKTAPDPEERRKFRDCIRSLVGGEFSAPTPLLPWYSLLLALSTVEEVDGTDVPADFAYVLRPHNCDDDDLRQLRRGRGRRLTASASWIPLLWCGLLPLPPDPRLSANGDKVSSRQGAFCLN
jgi:hypothetical protein